MKKSFQRILSAALVLVFAFGAVPSIAAFALTSDVQPEAQQPEEQAFADVTDAGIKEDAGEFIESKSIAGYKYSVRDSYFYVDQDKAWQGKFGYTRAYDIVAPYLLLEYDYVRVHFTYEDKDWMVQLWKGQYGMVFYGCEAGAYTKPVSAEDDTSATIYDPAKGKDRPYMQTTLYHDPLHIGKYEREFTTPYEQTWWSTGFKPGHLTVQEPANELRQTGVITFRNEDLALLFAQGLTDCGFTRTDSSEEMETDTFCIEGPSVYYNWQDISEAENTMEIKVALGSWIFLHFAAFLTVLVVILGALIGFGLLMLII